MANYTPINKWKISKASRDFLRKAEDMAKFPVEKIYVNKEIFDDLLEGISLSSKSFYSDSIPFEGKILVRK